MNSGLTSLMMWMLNSGNDKKRAKEAELRQQLMEDRQNRMLVSREALMEQRAQAARDWQESKELAREERYRSAKLEEEKRAGEIKDAHTLYGLQTIKQNANSGVPFSAWEPSEQEAVLRLTGGDFTKAEQMVEKVRAGATVAETMRDVAKAKADTAKAANDLVAAEVESPYVARRTIGEQANRIATLNAGGRSPSETVGPHNMAVVDDTGAYKVSPNPFNKPKEDVDIASLISGASSVGGTPSTVAGLPIDPNLTPPKTVNGVDAQGNVIPVVVTKWPSAPKDPSTGELALPVQQDIRPSLSTTKFADEVRRLQQEDLPPTTETQESLAEKFRREKELQDQKYRLPIGYTDRFTP